MSSYEERLAKRREKYLGSKPAQESVTTPAPENTAASNSTVTYAANSPVADRLAGRLAKYSDPVVDGTYINTFISDAQNYLNSADSDYGLMGYTTGSSVFQSRLQANNNLQERRFAIERYLEGNKDSLDSESYEYLRSFLDEFGRASASSLYAFYRAKNQFNDERLQGYNISDARAGLTAFSDQKAEEIAQQEDESFWERIGRYLGPSSDTSLPGATISQVTESYRNDTSYREPTDKWTDDLRNAFGYLYSQDPEKAYDFAVEVNNQLNAQGKDIQRQQVQDQATSGFWSGFGHTLGAIGSGAVGLADYLNDLSEYTARGTITEKSDFLSPLEYANAVTGGVSQHLNKKYGTLNENIPVIGGKGWGDVYGLGNSSAQSMLSGHTLGRAGTLIMFFGSAAASGIDEAKSRGATDEQALTFGTITGAAEAITELVPLNNLLNMGPAANWRGLFSEIIKQGGEELLGEGANAAITSIADYFIFGDLSNYEVMKRHYMERMNFSEEEAEKAAFIDIVEDIAFDALGGFVTGSFSAGVEIGVSSGVQSISDSQYYRKVYGDSTMELIQEGLESAEGSLSYELAVKYQDKLNNGGTLTGAEIHRLVDANEQQFLAEDADSIRDAAAKRLVELGETQNVMEVADILAKQATRQRLTKSERSILQNSRYGQRVSNELNPTNIQSGDYSSAWAQGLDTQRINPGEYSRLVEAAQQPQESAETSAGQVATNVPKSVQVPQTDPMEAPAATVRENRTVEQQPAANGQQMTGKLTAEESSAVAEESSVAQEKPVTLEEASKKYGSQAKAMIRTYQPGQDVAKFDKAYQAAYDMGRSYVNIDYALKSATTSYLTDSQKELAYNTGRDAADTKAKAKDAANKAAVNGKTGWKKGGVVRGEGVTIADLKKAFNDPRGKAYKSLSTIAKVTGVNIVLYKSQTDADGNFIGEQGKFDPDNPNELRIDINAGLENISEVGDLERYVLLRTFSHEFTHFIEKWNPIKYNEFRRAVFDALDARAVDGKNAHAMIELKMKETGLGYEAASREVVADAMTDILPDSNFVQMLAEKHQTIFQKLLEKLKEFVQNLRDYFDSIAGNRDYAANALKDQIDDAMKYMDSIVQMWDQIAVEAVENYQATVATEEVVVAKTATAETVIETKPEKIETTVEESAPVVTKDAYGFTIYGNEVYGSLEIKFDGKPPQYVIDVLKASRFRWHKSKKVWYGYAERELMSAALNEAFAHSAEYAERVTKSADTVAEEPDTAPKPVESVLEHRTPAEAEPVAQKPVTEPAYDPNDPYVRLANLMGHRARFEHEGFVYRVLKAGPDNSMWQGRIDAADVSVGGVYITNARGIHYTSELYENRDDARDDIIAVARISKLLDEKPTETTKPNEEVNDNGITENGTDAPAVHEPVRGSEGPARLLEGVEPEAVHGSDDGRQPVQSGSDQGTGDAGRDRRADAEGSVSERSTRDRVGGDLQQLPAVTEAETDNNVGSKKAEKLHEEVQQQIEQKSTENPKGSNFVIGDSLNLPSGTKARTRANIEAIKLVKQIAAEGRIATPAEQETLSKYVGWGGLADAFGKPYSNRETRKIEYEAVKGLEAEFEELKSVLTEEEYKSARESTKNAHYTSIEVIKAMYDGLKQLGFTGGRMLEPSSGVGNFVGAMPADMTAQVKSWTMVELDNITGLFAKYLYPNADVRIQGFEQANIPDGYMDVAIGNVPFGNYAITDKHYPKAVTSAIHNYFFAKSLDKVRTGGIVMFITSAYTMNSSDSAVRKYIMQRADLLGAIRLPNTAFAGNAGTSVVTDILILKKRADRTEYAGEAFESSNWERVSKAGWDGAYVNEYFIQHPEMVLGTPKLTRGMYSSNELTYDPFTDRGSLGDQIREAMKNIQGKMDYSSQLSPEKANYRQASAKKKRQKLQVKDGVIHAKDENGNLTKVDVDKDTAARIAGMVAIRDAHVALCDALQQGVIKKESNALRKALNKAYDSFVEKYGYLNAPKNKKAINNFADRYAILSLENYSTEGKKVVATKSDIFTKDTIAANRTASSADNVEEGLTISLNTVGSVDVAMIARLTGQKAEIVTRQLIDQRLVFKDKDGNLIPAAQYLSGNVRAKLREMEGLTGIDSDYQNNVEALREVVPPTVQHTDIYVNPGANWVPVSVYEDFVGYILKRQNYTAYRTGKKDFSVEYVPETNEYKVSINDSYAKMSAQNTQVWGEGGKSFNTIFENMLNGRRTNVYKDAGDGTRVLDKAKTEAVAEKVEKLNEEFRKWLWEDEARRAEMQELYNETYNALVTPKYSGASLTVNGLNSTYELRPHQKDAVARIINSGGNTLLAHRVGAGKTMEMAAAAMKLKQLGVIKKPMFVVPNNVVAQWGNEFKDYFPAANILVVGDEDMTAAERMTTINKIKNNDYDAVILAYTKFEKIQMTTAWRQKFYEEQIDSIMFAINAEKESQGGKGFTVKQLETKRKQLENKLKKLTDKEKDEDGAMFEDLGVDSLFVDEAHNFKNLEYSTRMNNVSGLGKADGAQRSFDLYTKVRYLQQLNGGRGVVFATATPVMNSMTEMYIMQKYLQPDTLKQLGIEHFDSWAKMFGEVVNALEIAPSGSGYRLKQTFSKFKNVRALQQLFRSFTDVLTDVPGLKIPKMKDRKVQIVECEQGEFQKNYMAELAERANNVKNVDPSEDNMLKITSDGRKISYSQRMIDPSLPYEETGKIYKCCDNVYAVYQESNKTKGTQMIFCDMATPKGKSSTKSDSDANTDEFAAVDMESAQLYDDIKSRLVQLGIPAKEIAFIHDAKNDKQKAALSEKMNNGTIRVLIGSTGKMGVGLNAQKKAVAIHHLDAPWRPGDIEQRDGRVFRQKNENEEAYKFVYVTRGSFDSRLWDILERKQKFINQVMNGEDVGNEIEDTGEVTLSAAEVKAVASDNPLIVEQVALEKEISKLQSLQQAHRAGVSRAQEKMAADRRNIALLEHLIASGQEDIRNRKDTYSSDQVFSIRIGTQTFTDKKDAGTALVAAAQAKAKEGDYTDIGKFAGFNLRVVKTSEGVKGMLSGAGSYEFKTYPLNPTYGINHLIAVVEGIDERLAYWNKNLSEAKSDLETQKQLAAEPFAQAEKLKQKRTRYNEVMDILNPPKEEQNLDTDGGDTVQKQIRANREEDPDDTADLVAFHNITHDLLLDVLRRKSLLMPSLAITNRGMTDFGEISLLFDKDTIDPAVNSQNKLYGADAWTPTQTKLKKNAKFDTDKTVNAVNTMKNSIGSKYVSELFDITPKQFKETIIRADGSIYDAYAHNIGVQTAYAMEQSILSEIPTNKNGTVNTAALQEQLNSELDTDNGWRKYKKWLNNISDTVITSYDQASNEDILKNMKAQPATAKSFKLSVEGELVVPAAEYATLDDVRKNKNRLYENAAEATKAVADEFLSLANRIGNIKTVVNAINAAFAARYSSSDIVRTFNQHGVKISVETAKEVQSLYKKAVELPTQYFEAKPHRSVGLDEIKAVVLPNSSEMAELRSMLNNLGVPIIEYTAGSNRSRVEAINSVEDIQFQQRTHALTDREVLALAASQVKVSDLTDTEKNALDIFQQRLSKLEDLQAQRVEQGRLYKEQQFGAKVDKKEAAKTLNRMHTLDSQIQKASAEVLSVEEKVVLKRVLQKARKVVENQQWTKDQETLKRWRDRRNNSDAIKKYRDRLRGDVDELTNWILHPDNKNMVKHIPDALKNTVIPFLSSINFMSKRSLAGGNATAADKAFMEQLRKLAKVMDGTVDVDEMYTNYTDLPPDFMQNLHRFIDTAQDIVDNGNGEFIINQMTSQELQELSKVVRTLKKYIMQMNRFHVNAMFQHVYEAGDNSIDFLAKLNPAEHTGGVSQFLLWQQMRPAYAFERFGEGGMAIYDGLRRGQATLAFNTKKIQAFSEKAYTTAEVRSWDDQVKTIRLGPGKTVKMRVSQIMSLYELNKREQAKGHILGEGIRVATFKDGRKKISDVGHTLTPGELNLILRELTPRQIEVADKLQQFMEKQGGEWGNYVTVARFGEKQFGEENYFPINSDGRHLSVDADEKPGAASLYALLNMGFTKQTQEKAKNRIVVYSIFDVFANHMASMAQYNAFALPVIDALKWFNYQRIAIDEDGRKTILGSVREQMDRAYGVPEESRPGSGRRGYAQNFIINIIKAFNGTEAQGTPYDDWGMKTLHHYNRAQVAYNTRVAMQQPLAVTRAAMLLDYTSIIKGMKLNPAAIQKNIREMQQYSGIAAWKSLGFYDVNISRGLTSLIKHDETAADKIIDFGMLGAETADTLTWAGIWSACKEEVIRKQKLTPKNDGFYEAVTKLFEDVIYKTQVVDSVLTKNEFMRDKGFFARAVGSFMSEPTTTASMLVDSFDKFNMDMQRGMNRQQAWKKNRHMIVRTVYVYGLGALVLAAVQAVADAFRDDDDYQEWMEKWLEAFGGNLVDEFMPFNKLPIVSDFYELAKELLSKVGVDTYGNPPQSVFMQWYDSLVKGVEILYDRISGEDTDYTWYGGAYKLLQALSGLTGLPMAAATREVITAWNNTVGAMAPSLKVKTYEPGEQAQIKYAYLDGYLSAEEAMAELMEKGIAETENDAYWFIQEWRAGAGYSKYGALYNAARHGGAINGPMEELTSHGHRENDVLSQLKTQIGDWYKEGEISRQEAMNMLSQYFDLDSEEVLAIVNRWSSTVVTGIAFDDIKTEFMDGNITAQRAVEMYVRYGGYSQEDASELVNKWRAEKETGIAYDDIKEAFMDGELTEADVKNMYIEYGNYSSIDAATAAAEEATTNWSFEMEYGFAYSDRIDAYKQGIVSASEMRTALMEFGGMSEVEADNNIRAYEWMKNNPQYDLSVSTVLSYTKPIDGLGYSVEDSGITPDVFVEYKDLRSECTGVDSDGDGRADNNTVKNQVMAVIDALPITVSQKDALYFLNGWAKSKLNQAPWH